MAEDRQTKGILARAREFNFLAAVLYAVWVAVSAFGALALRAYQSFGIGNTALLAAGVALLGIWGIPRIFERVRPRKPTFKEIVLSVVAALLVLFVWTANKLPPLFRSNESPVVATPDTGEIATLREQLRGADQQITSLTREVEEVHRSAQRHETIGPAATGRQAFITDTQRIEFNKALRYRILTNEVPENVSVRIYADATNETKAFVLAEMLLAAGWKPVRDSTDSFALRPDFNIAPGITVRHPSAGSDTMKAWDALRQALSTANIPYENAATSDGGVLTFEVGH